MERRQGVSPVLLKKFFKKDIDKSNRMRYNRLIKRKEIHTMKYEVRAKNQIWKTRRVVKTFSSKPEAEAFKLSLETKAKKSITPKTWVEPQIWEVLL